MTDGMTRGSTNKNLSAMIPKDRVILAFEKGSIKVVPSKSSRVTSRSRNLTLANNNMQ